MSTSIRVQLNQQLLELHKQAADFLERNLEGENGFPIDDLCKLTLSVSRLGDTSRHEETFKQQMDLFISKDNIETFETVPYVE